MPANLLSYKCSVVISYGSATLYEAANIGKLAVSLVNIIRSMNSEQPERFKKYLLCNSKDPIEFPKTIEELGDVILRNVS